MRLMVFYDAGRWRLRNVDRPKMEWRAVRVRMLVPSELSTRDGNPGGAVFCVADLSTCGWRERDPDLQQEAPGGFFAEVIELRPQKNA